MNSKLKIVAALALCVALAACADASNIVPPAGAPGFWHGLWHGMILPIAWIISLFDSGTAIYATVNSGGWYDFGFLLGVGGIGFGASR
jgi:hypothetical protein